MKKHISNVKKWYKNFKTITKIKIYKKTSLPKKIYKKRYQAETTDESESLS